MEKVKIKKGDTVRVIAGAGSKLYKRTDKEGKGTKKYQYEGKVLTILLKQKRLIVEGYNMVSKHKKPRKQGEPSGIIKMEAPVAISNVMLVCPKCGDPTRVGYKFFDDKKVRVCKNKACGETIDKL